MVGGKSALAGLDDGLETQRGLADSVMQASHDVVVENNSRNHQNQSLVRTLLSKSQLTGDECKNIATQIVCD